MTKYRRAVFGYFLLCVMAVGCSTARMHPEFAQKRAGIKTVAVLPPDVDVELRTFTGENKTLYALASTVRHELIILIEKEMAAKGFSTTKAKLDEEDFAEEPELRFELTQALADFQRRIEEITRSTKGKELRYSLGPEVSLLGRRANADALVFTVFKGFQKSSGELAKDRIIGLLAAGVVGLVTTPTGGEQMQAALVESSSGEVLWYDTRQLQFDPEDSAGLAFLVKTLFKDLSSQ